MDESVTVFRCQCRFLDLLFSLCGVGIGWCGDLMQQVGTPRGRQNVHEDAQERFVRLLERLTEEEEIRVDGESLTTPPPARFRSSLRSSTSQADPLSTASSRRSTRLYYEEARQRLEDERLLIELEKMRIQEIELRAYRKKLELQTKRLQSRADEEEHRPLTLPSYFLSRAPPRCEQPSASEMDRETTRPDAH